jgi:hypothetical protein
MSITSSQRNRLLLMRPTTAPFPSCPGLGKSLQAEFLVQDAGAGGVAMLHLAPIADGHRLEGAMRMLAHTAPVGGRRERRRAGMVRQQERVQGESSSLPSPDRGLGESLHVFDDNDR